MLFLIEVSELLVRFLVISIAFSLNAISEKDIENSAKNNFLNAV